MVIEHDANRITGVRGDPEHPANFGKLCSKGSTLHLTAQPAAQRHRATEPLLRPARGLPYRRASWNQALETGGVLVAKKVKLSIEVQLVEKA